MCFGRVSMRDFLLCVSTTFHYSKRDLHLPLHLFLKLCTRPLTDLNLILNRNLKPYFLFQVNGFILLFDVELKLLSMHQYNLKTISGFT